MHNSSFAQSSVHIAFVDTGFCPEKIKIKNIQFDKTIDFTESVKLNCSETKIDLKASRFHGQSVITEFLKYLSPIQSTYILHPLIVFDAKGDQKREYWLKTIDWIKKNKIDLVVTASGFMTNEKLVSELPGIWFVSSGRVTPEISKESNLFPQNLAPLDNLFLIGDYYDGKQVLYDQGLLFQDKIDYYFPSGTKGFVGTSRGVAEASARAIKICGISKMRECLKKHSKTYNDNLSMRIIQTF